MAVFAAAGWMFVAGAAASRDGALRVDSTGGLRDTIATRAAQNERTQAEIDSLTAQVRALQASGQGSEALDQVLAEAAELAPVVGLTEVKGPGVTIVLDDAEPPDPMPDGFTGDDYIVHQQDVQGVVNALWRGGASGVTVMGQRLISTSAVRCVGNTVILHGRVYSPPFVIAGVGNIPELEAALEADDSVSFFREWAKVVGMRYEQTPSRQLVLPPYSGPLIAKHAEVAP